MAGSVIVRNKVDYIDGIIVFDDHPSDFNAAESLAGYRLDRRRNYAIVHGEVCESGSWSQACSGCYSGMNSGDGRGMGCKECGHTGRRRVSMWIPILKSDLAILFGVDRVTIARRIQSGELRTMPGTTERAKKVRIHGDDFPDGLKRPHERKQKLSQRGKRQ